MRPGVMQTNGPRHIYSFDQHESLIEYGIILLACIDADSRKMMYETACNHKRAIIHYVCYQLTVLYYGACTVLRGDRGTETLWAQTFQRMLGLWAVAGSSHENVRIERHWGDTRSQLLDGVMVSLAIFEGRGELRRWNLIDRVVLHATLISALNTLLAEAALTHNDTPRRRYAPDPDDFEAPSPRTGFHCSGRQL